MSDRAGEAVSLAVRDALFEQHLDIADDGVLFDIGARFGVTPIDPAAGVAAARADWQQGQARGVRGSPHFFVGERDWFCPSLVIHHDDDGFDVNVDDEELRSFYATAFG